MRGSTLEEERPTVEARVRCGWWWRRGGRTGGSRGVGEGWVVVAWWCGGAPGVVVEKWGFYSLRVTQETRGLDQFSSPI